MRRSDAGVSKWQLAAIASIYTILFRSLKQDRSASREVYGSE
jgi:hypothetical protein